jgi:hypothetical protein
MIFRLAMRKENAAVGRARKRVMRGTRRVVIRPRGDGEEEEEDKKEGGVGKIGCRFHLVSIEGFPRPSSSQSVGSTSIRQSGCA